MDVKINGTKKKKKTNKNSSQKDSNIGWSNDSSMFSRKWKVC